MLDLCTIQIRNGAKEASSDTFLYQTFRFLYEKNEKETKMEMHIYIYRSHENLSYRV